MSTKEDAIRWLVGFSTQELVMNIRAAMGISEYSEEDCEEALDLAAEYITNRNVNSYRKIMGEAYADAARKGVV